MPEIRPHKRLRRQITETSAEDDNEATSDYNLHDQDTIYVKASDSPIKKSVLRNLSSPRPSLLVLCAVWFCICSGCYDITLPTLRFNGAMG